MPKCFFAIFFFSGLFLFCCVAKAQDIPGATRGDIEVGATYSNANTATDGYLVGHPPNTLAPRDRIWGGSIYANLNTSGHFGLTVQFDYPDAVTPDDYLQKSYLAGMRYIYPIHSRFIPYGKALVGLASMSYDRPVNWIIVPGTPGSYAAFAYGGGLDVRFSHRITVRAIDVQFEDWPGFPGGAIHPSIISIGAAYRIH